MPPVRHPVCSMLADTGAYEAFIRTQGSSQRQGDTHPTHSSQSLKLADVPFILTLSASKLFHFQVFRQIAKRWHPDKFQHSFGPRLCPEEKDEIMQQVKATFQALNEARAPVRATIR